MLKKKILLIIGILILLVGFILLPILRSALPVLFGVVVNKNQIQLKTTSQDNSINILLLGHGGGTHEGPNLTDTMMLVHVDSKKDTVTMVSIPRDLWIPDMKAKINQAYADGQDKGNKGMLTSEAVVEQVTGQSIDYVIALDFSGFVKLVDYLGGIDVNVQRTFDDYAYPIEGKEDDLCGLTPDAIASLSAQVASGSATELDAFPCRYEHVHFDKGKTHMDGQTALEFVRSRHSLGIEGTDFARAKRQQEVITAVRQKALSLGIILNPLKVVGIYTILKDNINTDIQPDEYDDFIKLAQKMQHPKISSYVIGDSDTDNYGLLVNPPPSDDNDYQWVLSPRQGDNDFSEIKQYVSCVFKGNVCEITDTGILVNPTPSPTPTQGPLPTTGK